jgi:hypothetical protein
LRPGCREPRVWLAGSDAALPPRPRSVTPLDFSRGDPKGDRRPSAPTSTCEPSVRGGLRHRLTPMHPWPNDRLDETWTARSGHRKDRATVCADLDTR